MAVVFGMLVGLALGLTGGGGTILAVPFLVYGLGVGARSAVVVSLLVVGITALFGAFSAWRKGLVEVRAGLIFAAGGVLTAPLGIALGNRFAHDDLLMAFAILMLAVAAHMFITAVRKPEDARALSGNLGSDAAHEPGTVCHYSTDGILRVSGRCGMILLLLGTVAGVLSGLFGVGVGFLIVPVLVVVTEMGIHRAVATSLLVIPLIGLTGVGSGLLSEREIDWTISGLFLLGGLAGMGLGQRFAGRLAGPKLQKIFALALCLMGGYMLLQG